jgi:hypothetical protein
MSQPFQFVRAFFGGLSICRTNFYSQRVRFGFRILESPNKVSFEAHHLRESQRDPFK